MGALEVSPLVARLTLQFGRVGGVFMSKVIAGHYFKILTRQGPNAPCGKDDYVISGNMIAGYRS